MVPEIVVLAASDREGGELTFTAFRTEVCNARGVVFAKPALPRVLARRELTLPPCVRLFNDRTLALQA